MDMLVNLSQLPLQPECHDVRILRALAPDREAILSFVREQFSAEWAGECAVALSAQPSHCFVAASAGRVVGFACYDATAKGFFGPTGVDAMLRNRGIGQALLVATLHEMYHEGYGYAVIGWCDEAQGFYAHTVNAVPIVDSKPEQSVYNRLIGSAKQTPTTDKG